MDIEISLERFQYSKILRSTVFLHIGHSDIRSPHIWQVPWPHRNIIFFSRSKHTGHIVWNKIWLMCCNEVCTLKFILWQHITNKYIRKNSFLTCSLMSFSCSCNFWTSEFEVSFPPLFMVELEELFPWGEKFEWLLFGLSADDPASEVLQSSPPLLLLIFAPLPAPSVPLTLVGLGSTLPSIEMQF